MSKLKDYWDRWWFCYRLHGFSYTVRKTFRRFGERRLRKQAERRGETYDGSTRITPQQRALYESLALTGDKLNVGFRLHGGLGDYVVLANYVHAFRCRYDDEILRLDILASNSFNSAKTVLYDGFVIDHLYNEQDLEETDCVPLYDLFVDLSRYPGILKRNDEKIAALMPELFEFIFLCERFRAENRRFFTHAGIADGQSAALSIIGGKKRINQPDIYGFFGLTETYRYPLPVMEDAADYLRDIGLSDRPYITINRGVDTNYTKSSVKLWPLAYYNALTRSLKRQYPDILLVQLGASYDRCPPLENIDVDLVGKTNLEQIKPILRHALVHIDGEGGMVHLRHALGGGRSVVLFGPTSPEFFGYSENQNLVGGGCDVWCEWALNRWQEGCLRGSYETPPCMASITPEMVMDAADRIIREEVRA